MGDWLKKGVLSGVKLLVAGLAVVFFATVMGIAGYSLLNAIALESGMSELARMTSQPDPGNVWVIPGFGLMAAAGLVVALFFSVLFRARGWKQALGAAFLWGALETLAFIALGGGWGSPLKNPLFYTIAGVFLGPLLHLAAAGFGRLVVGGKHQEEQDGAVVDDDA